MPYGIVRLIDRRQPAIFAALPPTAFLPRKNSAGLFGEGKSEDNKEEDAGILAYAKDDDAVRADFHRRKNVCVLVKRRYFSLLYFCVYRDANRITVYPIPGG